MEGYINAADQVKQDILEQYMKYYKITKVEDVMCHGKNANKLFDNIEIVFRNSAKAKMFSGKIKKTFVEIEELVPVYFTTSDDESYKDCMNAITLCKRISYFLFTNRAENFDLTIRNTFNENLRKHQEQAPEQAVEIYNHTKDLFVLIDQNIVDYAKVQPRVEKYLQSLGAMLTIQKEIYVCEIKLCVIFKKYCETKVLNEWFSGAGKVNRVGLNALIQVVKALDKRGLEVPKVRDRVNPKAVNEVLTHLEDHITTIQSEVDVLEDMIEFISEIIKYMERGGGLELKSQEVKKAGEPDTGSMSKKFLNWIRT